MPTDELEGRRILVTGGSAGIGEATVRACANAGARVAAVARRGERLEALERACGAVPITVDLTDERAARDAVDRAGEVLGGLDAVINNAGIMRPALISESRAEDWRAMFELNVLTALVVTQQALPHLRAAGRADVVNISSQSGRRVASAAGGVYSATKFALHALSEGLRMELAGTDVRVTVISPGFVQSEIFEGAADNQATERLRQLQAEVGLPAEAVANQIVWALRQPPDVHLREVVLAPTRQAS